MLSSPAAIEAMIERVRFGQWLVRQKTGGIPARVIKALEFEITDVNALPADFVIRTANEGLIRETFCVGFKDGMPLPSVPGVAFTIEQQTVSTRR